MKTINNQWVMMMNHVNKMICILYNIMYNPTQVILSSYLKAFFTASLVFLNIAEGMSTTYTSVANGNWTSSSTWSGSAIPPTTLSSGDSIKIRHTINYNASGNIEINGVYLIEPLSGTTANLTIPSGRNIDINASGRLIIKNATFYQRRFSSGNDGQPYSGNNPGATPQSGNFTNRGYINILNSYIEVAQNWTSESGGKRIIRNGCLYAGQNYNLSGSTSVDTLQGVTISVGWHGSGTFEVSDATMYLDDTKIQIAGTSGHFKLNSGNVNGDIDYISLRNHIVPFTGSGNIEVSSSVNNSPSLNLDAYCASSSSNLIHNSKFSGSITQTCSLNYFPGNCNGTPLIPLSVNHINFKVYKKGNGHNVLNWSVAGEKNYILYEIERSDDGEDWTTLDVIKLINNSEAGQAFQYIDASPLSGINYYRIKSVDYKNMVEFSEVHILNNKQIISDISVFPNPGSEIINLSMNHFNMNANPELIKVYLINIEGREMPLEFKYSNGILQFDATSIQAGYYFVKIRIKDALYNGSLAIVH